jgi:hypothetical protein
MCAELTAGSLTTVHLKYEPSSKGLTIAISNAERRDSEGADRIRWLRSWQYQ